jgi:hypothetical protein
MHISGQATPIAGFKTEAMCAQIRDDMTAKTNSTVTFKCERFAIARWRTSDKEQEGHEQMDGLAEAMERAAEFTRFENQQRYMFWMIAMRREILRLQAAGESRVTANSVGDLGSTHAPSQQAPSLKRRAGWGESVIHTGR